MAKEKKRLLKVGEGGTVKLPPDAMEHLGLEPGESVQIFVDTRRKQIRLERHVDDPWAEALKQKPETGFDELMDEQAERDEAANRLFDERLKDPPKPDERRPEDDPDYWR
jgi:antitoxin component of MazEF toxin-antitoxin module